MILPTAKTMVAGVIGDPVRHSLSPILHNAAFAEAGLDWTYVAFPVAPGNAAAAVEAMRALEIGGLSVTMPHKQGAAEAADSRSPVVAALQAANCLRLESNGTVSAHNTDGSGFVRAVEGDADYVVAGSSVVVIGAGGAARAVVRAVADAGASTVVVINRSNERAVATAALAGPAGRVGDEADIGAADLVINATPVGMETTPGRPIQLVPGKGQIGKGQILVDLIYQPDRTELMVAAEAAGAQVFNGLSMLLHQAAVQFELWTHIDAPIDAMRTAIVREINRV